MFVFGIFFISLALNDGDGETASTNQPSPTEFHHNGMMLTYEDIVTLEMPPTKGLVSSPILVATEVGDQGDKAALKEEEEARIAEPQREVRAKSTTWRSKKVKNALAKSLRILWS